jgi:hypothetical protein
MGNWDTKTLGHRKLINWETRTLVHYDTMTIKYWKTGKLGYWDTFKLSNVTIGYGTLSYGNL